MFDPPGFSFVIYRMLFLRPGAITLGCALMGTFWTYRRRVPVPGPTFQANHPVLWGKKRNAAIEQGEAAWIFAC
jgi:hypothetical protein